MRSSPGPLSLARDPRPEPERGQRAPGPPQCQFHSGARYAKPNAATQARGASGRWISGFNHACRTARNADAAAGKSEQTGGQKRAARPLTGARMAGSLNDAVSGPGGDNAKAGAGQPDGIAHDHRPAAPVAAG